METEDLKTIQDFTTAVEDTNTNMTLLVMYNLALQYICNSTRQQKQTSTSIGKGTKLIRAVSTRTMNFSDWVQNRSSRFRKLNILFIHSFIPRVIKYTSTLLFMLSTSGNWNVFDWTGKWDLLHLN